MRMLDEYISWFQENQDLYLELKEHESILYDRFLPLLEVLNHITSEVLEGRMQLSDDLEKIFSIGFEYVALQFETVKLYLDTVFKGDLHELLEYQEVLSALLYAEDLRYEIAEKEANVDSDLFDSLIDKIETILQNKEPIDENFAIMIDDEVKALLKDESFDFYGIIDIFVEVAETLGIYLYEEEDILLGKDI